MDCFRFVIGPSCCAKSSVLNEAVLVKTNLDDCTGVFFPGLGQYLLEPGSKHACVD